MKKCRNNVKSENEPCYDLPFALARVFYYNVVWYLHFKQNTVLVRRKNVF